MTEAITTAEQQIVDSLDRAQKCLDRMFDPTKDKVDHTAILSLISHFNTVVLLEALRRKDPTEADRITQWLDDIHEDGSTAGELVYQWREEIGRGHQLTGIGGYKDEQPAPPAEARQITVRTGDGDVRVLAVDSDTPGLVLAQDIRSGVNGTNAVDTGRWTIRHADTGILAIPTPYGIRPSWPLDVARRVAAQLGALGADWTLPKEDFFRDVTPHIGDKVRDILRAAEDCQYCTDADHAPVTPWRDAPSVEADAPVTASAVSA